MAWLGMIWIVTLPMMWSFCIPIDAHTTVSHSTRRADGRPRSKTEVQAGYMFLHFRNPR